MSKHLNKVVNNLAFGLDNEIIFLSNYKKGYRQMFITHNLNAVYDCPVNFEMYCYLKYSCLDAEQMFIEAINNNKHKRF